MPPSPRKARPPRNVPQTMMRIWALAGIIGMCLAVSLASARPFEGLSPAANALLAILIGWVAMLCFAPWRQLVLLGRDRAAIRALARRLRQHARDGQSGSLRDLEVDRADEMGDLNRALRDVLLHAYSAAREKRRLQRTIDHEIRRETDRATQRLRREATTDPLTGLRNRRTLDQRLGELFGPAATGRRRGATVVAMIIDIDRFKAINDRLGHEIGDECLAFLGRLLASTLRSDDCAIRLGGDEFAVLLPEQSIPQARRVAGRIAALFRQMPWPHAHVDRPTLSVGLAEAVCGDPGAAESLLKRADRALYRSKRKGRDTITAHGELIRAA